MNNLEIIDSNNKEKWDNTVKSFNNREIFYLYDYVKAFENNGEGVPMLFYYNDKDTRAINVMLKRDISKVKGLENIIEKEKYYDLVSPYGYGGFIIEGDNYHKVNEEYNKYCVDNNIVCEFIRFNLFERYFEKYDGTVQNLKHNIVREINMNPQEMLMDFEHKVRKNINKANRANLIVNIDEGFKDIDSFLKIYYSTMDRNNAENNYYFSKEFFENFSKMNNNAICFNVIYEDKIISNELVIYEKDNCYSYLGGTLSEYFDLRPNDFLKYEIIKWAHQKEIKNYILGGGYGREDDGIYRYKKSFAPNGIYDFYIGKKIFNNEIYNKLCEYKNISNDEGFFPAYRKE